MVSNLQTVRGRLAALELMTQAEVHFDLDEIVAELGISEHASQVFGPLVLTNGHIEQRRFEYDYWDQAVLAFIVYNADEVPIDVVAFALSQPNLFGTRLGQAGMLGESFLRSPSDEPCLLFRDPLEWLEHEGRGVCVLSPIVAAPKIASAKGSLAAVDVEHAEQLVESGAVPVQRLLVPAERCAT